MSLCTFSALKQKAKFFFSKYLQKSIINVISFFCSKFGKSRKLFKMHKKGRHKRLKLFLLLNKKKLEKFLK